MLSLIKVSSSRKPVAKKFFLLFVCCFAVFSSAALPPEPAVSENGMKPPRLKMMLPEIIYAAPGIESNIYFENVIDSAVPGAYAFEVKCARGTQGNTRWFWTPDTKDAGKSFDLELRLFNDYGMVLSEKCKVVVAAKSPDPERKVTLALLGDSGVNCRYPEHILKTMRELGFVNYTPVGSHAGHGKKVVRGGIAHDGYGGYSWGCFLARWAYSADELPQVQNEAERKQMISLGVVTGPKSLVYRLRSPLLSIVNGKKVVDIPGWFKKINQGKAPDYILIQLGGNDVFAGREENLDAMTGKVLNNARRLLSLLRKHAPDSVIAVTTQPCGCSQDGFGADYKCFQSRYQYRRNIQRYNRAITGLVRELKDRKIRLVPLHQAVDPDAGYTQRRYPVHARSKNRVLRHNNALHPALEGGFQMGDAVCCWLLNELGKK